LASDSQQPPVVQPPVAQAPDTQTPGALTAQELEEQRNAGNLIVSQIKTTIAFYNQQINEMIQKENLSGSIQRKGQTITVNILEEIKKTEAEIKKIKDEAGITQKEAALTQMKEGIDKAAIYIFAKAVPPDKSTNYYKKINADINQIYNDDSIKSKMNRLLELQREIANNVNDANCPEGRR